MMGNHKNLTKSFKKINSWESLYNWHKQNTPWLGNEQIRLLMNSYHLEAL